ncbi:hypothetical protein E8D34_04455 [Nocardioides sp. GY 10113]|uniref:hypothetical protein n=1 Tax=Nocardioides sp. GY 10113 TaxID=2569761 RepID=UPI0010A90038|nr:hypothetical protein [Nocardioides sp. GY 10113]TIC88206.1 hypothetical protein E8D34_04455 [Nocardioides sp. GY 10113]
MSLPRPTDIVPTPATPRSPAGRSPMARIGGLALAGAALFGAGLGVGLLVGGEDDYDPEYPAGVLSGLGTPGDSWGQDLDWVDGSLGAGGVWAFDDAPDVFFVAPHEGQAVSAVGFTARVPAGRLEERCEEAVAWLAAGAAAVSGSSDDVDSDAVLDDCLRVGGRGSADGAGSETFASAVFGDSEGHSFGGVLEFRWSSERLSLTALGISRREGYWAS